MDSNDLSEPSVSSKPTCVQKGETRIVILFAIVSTVAAPVLLSGQPGMNLLS